MQDTSVLLKQIEKFSHQIFYWGNPHHSILAMNICLAGFFVTYFFLHFFYLRTFLTIGLWGITLKHSEFCFSISLATLKVIQNFDRQYYSKRILFQYKRLTHSLNEAWMIATQIMVKANSIVGPIFWNIYVLFAFIFRKAK